MKSIIADTSVITKWYEQTNEADVKQALRLLHSISQQKLKLIIPSITFLELANVLRIAKKIDREGCLKSIVMLQNLCEEVASNWNMEVVIDVMFKHNLASYDAIFIALSKERNLPLITADYKHHNKSIFPKNHLAF